MIKWAHILKFAIFNAKINFWGPFSSIFSAQEQSRTALGLLAPLEEPLKNQNPHFQFNIQILGDKMASHFEFQLFELKNKRLGSIFVHFFSPKAVADCSWANGTPGRATKNAKYAFSILRPVIR